MVTVRKPRLLITVALAASVAGCQDLRQREPDHADVAGVKRALATEEASWNKAFHGRDLDALVAFYASDAVFVLPGLSAQVGTAAIRKTYADALKDPNFDVNFASERVEVAQSGELAFTQGQFTMKGTDPKSNQPTTTATGSYLTVYKKQPDGSWKAIQDWTAATPPSSPAK